MACTGLWLGEAVHFVKKVEAAGYQVDYVSPRGGYTPIDPHSLAMADDTDWAWYQTKEFMNRLGSTLKPSDVNPDDYVAIYFAGGHGVIWDFPDNEELQSISRKIYEAGAKLLYCLMVCAIYRKLAFSKKHVFCDHNYMIPIFVINFYWKF